MKQQTADQSVAMVTDCSAGVPVTAAVAGFLELDESYAEGELSDRELLAIALEDAEEAQRAGVLGGPGVDQIALARAEHRADRAAAARQLRVRLGVAA